MPYAKRIAFDSQVVGLVAGLALAVHRFGCKTKLFVYLHR